MISCSVRKKGPKCVSKYSFSRRAWLLGADQRSTGLVVTWTDTRPEEHTAMKAREKKMMQPGFRTQKEPQCVKSPLRRPSNAALTGSQQDASPGRAGEEGRVEVKSQAAPESGTGKALATPAHGGTAPQHAVRPRPHRGPTQGLPRPSATCLLRQPPFLSAPEGRHPHPPEEQCSHGKPLKGKVLQAVCPKQFPATFPATSALSPPTQHLCSSPQPLITVLLLLLTWF